MAQPQRDRHPIDRRTRIEAAIQAQLAFIARVPDPDNRCRAEANLMALLEMRDHACSCDIGRLEVR